MKKTAVIMVDIQHDFYSPTGALSVPNASAIASPCLKLAERVWASRLKDGATGKLWKLFATQDWHNWSDLSFAQNGGQWPVHCVRDTKGAQLAWPWLERADYLVKKTGYSAFENTHLELTLKPEFGRVIVCGLALDYCVKATAMDAKRLGFETIVARDATAAVTVSGGCEADQDFQDNGIPFLYAEDIIRGN